MYCKLLWGYLAMVLSLAAITTNAFGSGMVPDDFVVQASISAFTVITLSGNPGVSFASYFKQRTAAATISTGAYGSTGEVFSNIPLPKTSKAFTPDG